MEMELTEGDYTIREMPEETEPESRWAKGCPYWIMVAVVSGRIKVLSHCGRYFDWESEDLDIMECDSANAPDKSQADGVYICEGDFVSDRDYETGYEEGGWEPGEMRKITDEEWEWYCESDEPWPPEFYAPPVEESSTTAGPIPAECSVADWDHYRWMLGEGLFEMCVPR